MIIFFQLKFACITEIVVEKYMDKLIMMEQYMMIVTEKKESLIVMAL